MFSLFQIIFGFCLVIGVKCGQFDLSNGLIYAGQPGVATYYDATPQIRRSLTYTPNFNRQQEISQPIPEQTPTRDISRTQPEAAPIQRPAVRNTFFHYQVPGGGIGAPLMADSLRQIQTQFQRQQMVEPQVQFPQQQMAEPQVQQQQMAELQAQFQRQQMVEAQFQQQQMVEARFQRPQMVEAQFQQQQMVEAQFQGPQMEQITEQNIMSQLAESQQLRAQMAEIMEQVRRSQIQAHRLFAQQPLGEITRQPLTTMPQSRQYAQHPKAPSTTTKAPVTTPTTTTPAPTTTLAPTTTTIVPNNTEIGQSLKAPVAPAKSLNQLAFGIHNPAFIGSQGHYSEIPRPAGSAPTVLSGHPFSTLQNFPFQSVLADPNIAIASAPLNTANYALKSLFVGDDHLATPVTPIVKTPGSAHIYEQPAYYTY